MVRFTTRPNFRWDHELKEVSAQDQGTSITPHATNSWRVDERMTIDRIIQEHPDRWYVFYLNEEGGLIWKYGEIDVVRMAFVPLEQPNPCPCCGKY